MLRFFIALTLMVLSQNLFAQNQISLPSISPDANQQNCPLGTGQNTCGPSQILSNIPFLSGVFGRGQYSSVPPVEIAKITLAIQKALASQDSTVKIESLQSIIPASRGTPPCRMAAIGAISTIALSTKDQSVHQQAIEILNQMDSTTVKFINGAISAAASSMPMMAMMNRTVIAMQVNTAKVMIANLSKSSTESSVVQPSSASPARLFQSTAYQNRSFNPYLMSQGGVL